MIIALRRRILRLVDPRGERERMEMRQARCVAEANAEDLVRTITLRREDIAELMRRFRERQEEKAK
jgi:hypothetical protein